MFCSYLNMCNTFCSSPRPPGPGDVGGAVSPVPGCFLRQGSAGGHGGELQPTHRAVLQLWGAVHLQGWVDEEEHCSVTLLLTGQHLHCLVRFDFISRALHWCNFFFYHRVAETWCLQFPQCNLFTDSLVYIGCLQVMYDGAEMKGGIQTPPFF